MCVFTTSASQHHVIRMLKLEAAIDIYIYNISISKQAGVRAHTWLQGGCTCPDCAKKCLGRKCPQGDFTEKPWETNAMAYAGMRAHDSTCQYISVRRETGRQCSKQVYHRLGSFATCHFIPLYLSRAARNVRAAQVVGAFFHEWIHAKQALGQSTNFLKLCMLKSAKTKPDKMHRCSEHVFNLSALLSACSKCNIKKTCITQQQTQFRGKRRGHCINSIQNHMNWRCTTCITSRSYSSKFSSHRQPAWSLERAFLVAETGETASALQIAPTIQHDLISCIILRV